MALDLLRSIHIEVKVAKDCFCWLELDKILLQSEQEVAGYGKLLGVNIVLCLVLAM